MKNLKKIPDINFRNRLKRLFPNVFENELLDINNNEIINCKILIVTLLKIKDLTGIEYFVNLKELWCFNNNLTTLPKLPKTLKKLWCSNNRLTSLPNLPDTLEFLGCCDNKLISLPNLPDTLKSLYCNNNMFPPAKLPKNLKYFEWSISYRNKNNQEEGERLEYKLIKNK